MRLTPFENEVVDSLLWQIKGFKEGYVTERATNRILRASLRRIKHRLVGYSAESAKTSSTDNDHAVPVKIIIKMLMEAPELSKDVAIDLLSRFYISVTITRREHTVVLKELDLESEMPSNWDGVDPLARYKQAGIEIIEN